MNEHEVEELLEHGVDMWVFFKANAEKTERIIKFLRRKNFLQDVLPERLKKLDVRQPQKLAKGIDKYMLNKCPKCPWTLMYRQDVLIA